MKKILFFACDPGGANAIIPLLKPLARQGKILIFGKGAALKKYQANGLRGGDIDKYLNPINTATVLRFLQKQSPAIIVTGTSANDMTEKYLWQASEQLRIPSLAILDQWMNYGIRFSRYGLKDIKKYSQDKQPQYLPTKILVMDDYAKQRLVKEGIAKEKIVATGNPYFEQILKSKNSFTKGKINKLKRSLGVRKNDIVVLFASEPLTLSYGDSKKYWGFSEEETLLAIINSLNELMVKTHRGITLLVKLHPKESLNRFNRLLKDLIDNKINIIIEHSRSSLALIMTADLVCGMFSMVLQEAVMLNKPIVSVTIGLKRKTIFVLDDMGLAKSVLSRKELSSQLEKIIIKKQFSKINLITKRQAIARVIKEIKKYAQVSN
jgi:UDP-N-acetylglucosamine 2-epimerase